MNRNDIINELESGRLGDYIIEQAIEHLDMRELDNYLGLEYLTEHFSLRELFYCGLYDIDELKEYYDEEELLDFADFVFEILSD